MATSLDPRTPVIVGVAQVSRRVDRGEEPLEPVDLIADASRRADADSGGRSVLAAVESVRVVKMLSWRYRDPGALIAARIGAHPRQSVYSTDGGQTPQALLSRTALDIAAGEVDLALLCGGEAWRTRMAYRREGAHPPWTSQGDDVAQAEAFGSALDMNHPAEAAQGLLAPVQMYAMFEVALRAASGRSVAEHRDRLAGLWSRFSQVAADNPNAWIRTPMSPEEVATPTPTNRYIGYPYTLVMNSNNNVEQAAAVLLCSVGRAEALGIPRDRWVFPQAGAEANDHPYVSNRGDLHSSPAIRAAGRSLYRMAGLGPDDLGPVDLYSCFPSAVQIAAQELGLGVDRPLTVTGGMSFAGGPWNNYALHAIATMIDVLRRDPGALGLCSANGGFTTKHALGLYGTDPPAHGFVHSNPQPEADAAPPREVAVDHEGPVEIEAYTVMHDREGHRVNGFVAALLADGRRTWGTIDDAATLEAMTEEELCGKAAHRSAGGAVDIR